VVESTTPRKDAPAMALLGALDTAIAALRRADRYADETVHDTRRALKRARAALHLLREGLGDAVYRRDHAALRDAARALAPLREARAALDALASLRPRVDPAISLNALEVALRQRLSRTRSRRARSAAGPACLATLVASRRRLRHRAVPRVTRRAMEHALAHLCRQGRKRMQAAEDAPQPAALHEWRKSVKSLGHALDIACGGEDRRVRSVARDAAKIGDWLGEHHDLQLLDRYVARAARRLDATVVVQIRAAMARRSRRLEHRSLRLGRELYASKARDLIG
jgi:CHAD domain